MLIAVAKTLTITEVLLRVPRDRICQADTEMGIKNKHSGYMGRDANEKNWNILERHRKAFDSAMWVHEQPNWNGKICSNVQLDVQESA